MRKPKALFIIFFVLFLLTLPFICHAYDTDLYVLATTVDVPPNVLIILDNSRSMDQVMSGDTYAPATDYSVYVPAGVTIYPRTAVYIRSGNNWVLTTIACPTLQTLLDTYGRAISFTGCGYTKKEFQIGNYRNFLNAESGPGGSRPRFGLAHAAVISYMNTTSNVNFKVMAFRHTVDVQQVDGTEYVFGDARDDALGVDGGEIVTDVPNLKNLNWSPLAETLYEAGLYFKGGNSAITGTTYPAPFTPGSPVQRTCQKNYILIISDGVPTKDSDPRLLSELGAATDLDPDGPAGPLTPNGAIELNEVAKYLYNINLNSSTISIKQNIKTYTITFTLGQPLMEDTAHKGGGDHFYVHSSQSFDVSFTKFISAILAESTSYVAPVVPISQMERTSSGNQMYLAMFKPTEKNFWRGNIKKYCIATKNSSGQIIDCSGSVVSDTTVQFADILDANGLRVIDSDNKIKNTAQSYWSLSPDGPNADSGGVGEKLLEIEPSARQIYTYFGTNPIISTPNAFNTTNITPELLGLMVGDETGKNNLVNFIRGYDSYSQNEINPQGPTYKKDWILGSFIHSRPVVIHYGNAYSRRTVVYAGANDGMLHAFDDSDGRELWGFIPQNLLGSLKDLTGALLNPGTPPSFVDGAPKAYIQWNSSNTDITSAILIFGERRGGNRYIALDITNPDSPQFLWEIGPDGVRNSTYTLAPSTDYGQLGQTWSTPIIGKIKLKEGLNVVDKWVAFVGGGYHINQDDEPPALSQDPNGNAVYIIDISNGNRIWGFSATDNAAMKHCIPSDVARIDATGDGYIDRVYVSDVLGQIWRFDIGDPDKTTWSGHIMFDSNQGESVKRKVFYPPEVTLETGYDWLFIGTGDREHPKNITKMNRLYGIKDKGAATLYESNLYDVTSGITDPATFYSKEGWYIKLGTNLGEKSLSNAVIFYGVVYYTTFQPGLDPTDPCYLSEGIARLYAVDYKTGNAVFNLDGSLDGAVSISDRSMVTGVSIPSGVIITFIGGETVAYAGVEVGVIKPPVPTSKTIYPVNWRIVF